MSYPSWDMPVSPSEFKKVLKNPRDRRFRPFLARVLSRVPFRHVFHRFVTPARFKRYYPQVRRLVDGDLIGAGKIEFWDWVYKKLTRNSDKTF